jgi:hypothetical protein
MTMDTTAGQHKARAPHQLDGRHPYSGWPFWNCIQEIEHKSSLPSIVFAEQLPARDRQTGAHPSSAQAWPPSALNPERGSHQHLLSRAKRGH